MEKGSGEVGVLLGGGTSYDTREVQADEWGIFIESHWIPQAVIMLSLEGTCELECPAQSGLVHKTSETIHKSHPTSRLDQRTQLPLPVWQQIILQTRIAICALDESPLA